jgi:membrane-associated protease RseP (regulator of RpoE activity)
MMQERAARDLMMPERGRPLERRRGEMRLQALTQPDSQELQVPPTWRIGVMVEPLDPFVRMHLGLGEDAGVRVSMVAEGDPAAHAGIQVDDIIVAADGGKIANLEALRAAVEKCGKENRPLGLVLIHRGERQSVGLQPEGPKPEAAPENRTQPGPDQGRPFVEIQRRLDRQEKMIQELRGEVKKLRRQVAELKKDEDDEEEDSE